MSGGLLAIDLASIVAQWMSLPSLWSSSKLRRCIYALRSSGSLVRFPNMRKKTITAIMIHASKFVGSLGDYSIGWRPSLAWKPPPCVNVLLGSLLTR